MQIVRDENFVTRLGAQVRQFHDASRQFAKDKPEAYAKMQKVNEVWKGMFKDVGVPDMPITEETYGIMHGDMHEGNYLVDLDNNFKVTFFDWDLTSKCHYLVDAGSQLV